MAEMTGEETIDEILGGSLKIRQSRRGYRFNLDSLILAHFVSLRPDSVNLDLGCGNGIIALVLAHRFRQTRWHGLELQPALAELARQNVEDNGLAGRVQINEGDAHNIKKIYQPHLFDNIIFNPPYRRLTSGRVNPMAEKAIARHEVAGSLERFLAAAGHALKPAGRVFTIYPATRLVEMISLFRKNAIEPKRMKLVFSDAASDAEFVLLEGRGSSGEELKVEQSLYIYEKPKRYTKEMQDIFSDLSLPAETSGG
ncbi:MAG: methyltransferase [Smithella sp.]|jgi:tRNA1Val (adenine37-N6)-methyltransferase|nr:methyltransferase [Smithella sp.]